MDEQHWKEIEENFDWKRVHRVMSFLDWEWNSSGGVPSIKELKACAKYLLDEVAKTEHQSSIATGGFYARKFSDELGVTHYELGFTLCDWETN